MDMAAEAADHAPSAGPPMHAVWAGATLSVAFDAAADGAAGGVLSRPSHNGHNGHSSNGGRLGGGDAGGGVDEVDVSVEELGVMFDPEQQLPHLFAPNDDEWETHDL